MKELRRLSRRSVRTERRLFLADGPKAVEGALAAGCVEELFLRPGAELPPGLDGSRPQAPVTLVEDRALDLLSDSVTPAGVVALCRAIDVPLTQALEGASLVAVCADVRDPGNAGTVIRCADAAGADAVVLAGDSVDLYNPKTLRASVGSAFHLPVAVERSAGAAVRAVQEAGLTVLATDGAGEVSLYDAPVAGRVAWLFGNEAWGLPAELAELAEHRVAIPIHGRAESLNLSTAAALCLYESARRR
ncbi:TrmH family RNA methyltransferase [Nocardioides flavescens]|uniref:TrmH family RNA methyltransferase n=1 Tax=Nocardioides flavescens TaxID=2691959 RepID=UPI003F6E4431